MITDKQIMKISLTAAMIGIAALYAFVFFTEPCRLKISEINESMTGRNVVVEGFVINITKSKDNVFLDVYNEKSIKVVVFSDDAKKQSWIYNLTPGSNITVIGVVSVYKGTLEIISDKIILNNK